MDLKLNSFNNYPQPVFTAQLKGTAIRSALRNAKDAFQLGEVSEIVSNIAQKGDNATIINCCADGTVTVSNDKFGIVSHKYNIKKWEQAENTGLDLLRNFSSDNGVLKAECKLIDYIFAHSKNAAAKKRKYDLYSSLPLSVSTRAALDSVAKKHKIIPSLSHNDFKVKSPEEELENFKSLLLENYQRYF